MSAPTTILVVDDDPRVRSLAEVVLRRDGYTIVSASGPQEALAAIASNAEIKLALIDIVLPVMTGFDLAAEIRRRAPSVRIVFTSGFRSDQFRQPVNEPVVAKPFTVDSLSLAVATALTI